MVSTVSKSTSNLSSLCWCHRWRVFKPSWWRRTLGYQCYELAWHGCWKSDWNSFSSHAMLIRNTGIPIGSLGSLQIGFFKRRWRLRTKGNWHLAMISPQHCIDCKHIIFQCIWTDTMEKNQTCRLEALRKSQGDQSQVGLRLFVALQLVGRDNFSAGHGCENHRAVEPVQILDAEGIGDDVWLDPNDPSDQTGGRFNSLWLLLNYNLGSQGARALGESLATGDWLNALLFLSQGCWKSDYNERLDTSDYLVLKKEFIDDVYIRLRSVSNLVVMTIFGLDPRAP